MRKLGAILVSAVALGGATAKTMPRFRQMAVASALVATLALPAAVAAEPLQITSGYLLITGVQDINSRGFLRGIEYRLVTEDFTFAWSEGDTTTQNPLAPVWPRPTYFTPTGAATFTMGFIADESAVRPVSATPSRTSPTPFTFSANFRIVDLEDRSLVLFDDVLFGSGMASWRYAPGTAHVSEVRYEFSDAAPTPEPTTLLLLGSGIAGALIRRRSARRAG